MLSILFVVVALVVNIVAIVAGFRGTTRRYKIARYAGALGVLMVFVFTTAFFYVVAHGMWKGPDDMRPIVYSAWLLGGFTACAVLAFFSIVYKRYFGA